MVMNGQKGFIKLAYVGALFLLGLLIWAFVQTKTGDLTEISVSIDNELTDTLVKLGFKNEDITSQSREEKKQGAKVWIEYYREIKLPKRTAVGEVETNLRAIAAKHRVSFKTEAKDAGRTVFEMRASKILLSRLVIDAGTKTGRAGAAKVAVVIDDLGYTKDLKAFLELGIPITFAILPNERYSKTIAAELASKKMPYLLHLPLEPDNYPKMDPGKAALLVSMTDSEIEMKFISALASVPGAAGVSNHMGSRFSSSAPKMRALLELVKDEGLFYFDSYTSSSTKAGKIAREIGLTFAENSVFIDVSDDKESMKIQFERALKKASKQGSIAVIGHISKKALPEALKEAIELYRRNGVQFVYLPDIVKKNKR